MFTTISEKRASMTSNSKSWSRTPGFLAIIFSQHLLLWNSLYVAASTLYILIVGAVFTNDVPSVVLLLVASFVSLSYIALQNVTTHLRKNARNRMQSETVDTCQCLASHTLRILCTIWMVTVALNITFTAARRAICAPSTGSESVRLLDKGKTCMINRVGILASCISLTACALLFIVMHKVSEPFRCHLFDFVKEESHLPLFLPYRKSNTRDTHPMFSDMYFKCRSSTSLSSNTLAAPYSQHCESTTNLIPSRPQGLGIFAPSKSARSLLHPRPSLSLIRSYTTMSLPPPPTSPLPPLPAYFPTKYRSTTRGIQKPVRPKRSDDTVRMIPTLLRSNNSDSSLSSVYSRSISGEKKPPSLSETGRSASDSSMSTLKRSPLGMVTVMEDPCESRVELLRLPTSRHNFDFETDIDDVAALEARLAHAKALIKRT